MSRDDEPKRKTGYKSPPIERQFKKGQSGNLAGRKPKPVRALLPRQIRKDILQIGETATRIRTPAGERVVSAYEAILYRMMHKALAGHSPSMRRFLDLYADAIKGHSEEFEKFFSFVEMVEHEQVEKPVCKENEKYYLRFLNDMRKKTRRL